MKKHHLLIGFAAIATTLISCKREDEKMAEKAFDRYEKYVDSVYSINETDALANWQAIEAGFEERMGDADMSLSSMADQTNANTRLDKLKTKYTEFKMKVEASAPKSVVVDRKTEIRTAYFGDSMDSGTDMDFTWVNKDNILKVYNDFYNEFDKNKDTYSREDFDQIKALYEALDSRKNTVENEGLTSHDNLKIAEIKFKFAPKFKWERMGAKAEENSDAKK